MAMGKRKRPRATELWIPTTDLPVAPSHPFYTRLNAVLHAGGFDPFVERAHGPTEPGAGRVLPAVAGRVFRRTRLGTRHSLASGRFPGAAQLSRSRPARSPTRSLDHLADAQTEAEHAVDLDTGAVVAVTVQDADDGGDTTTMQETLIAAADHLEAVLPAADVLRELVTDKGFHSNDRLVDLAAIGVRTYIAEPDRGRRCWRNIPEARAAVYANRRRIRGPRGVWLLRRRGESCSHRETHIVVAALRLDGLGAPAVFNGPIDTPTVLAYVEQVLVPTLRPGEVVVLDDLAVHQQTEVHATLAAVGAQLRFLPPYSPDFTRSSSRSRN